MDRFIVLSLVPGVGEKISLKSNMDRFIVRNLYNSYELIDV